MSFYNVGNRGTVRETTKYNPEVAVETLYRGMKGIGTDEDAIIDVVASHTFKQRQELKTVFSWKYGKDLIKELDSELSFHFLKTVLALMTPPEKFIIECIHSAISKSRAARLLKQLQKIYKKGLSSDEHLLLSLLCPRSNAEMEAIKNLYKQTYEKELQDDVGFDLGGDLRSLILDIISGDREMDDPDNGVDYEKVLEDADNLHGASFVPVGEICGTKERVLQQILNMRSYEHLRQLITAYRELANKPIDEYIEHSNLSQDLKEAYLTIIHILRDEPEYYAERLKDAIAGIGTDDDMLISIIVLRSEIDLRDIMIKYQSKFEVTLQEDVTGDTSGDYRHILLKLLNLPEEEEIREKLHTKVVEEINNANTVEPHADEVIMESAVTSGENNVTLDSLPDDKEPEVIASPVIEQTQEETVEDANDIQTQKVKIVNDLPDLTVGVLPPEEVEKIDSDEDVKVEPVPVPVEEDSTEALEEPNEIKNEEALDLESKESSLTDAKSEERNNENNSASEDIGVIGG